MGSPTGQGIEFEHPQHTVYLDAYQIGKYEVTNAQFAAFVAATGYRSGDWQNANGALTGYATNYPDNPVICLTWNNAKAFCDYYGCRLPTEAEWEKAARGTDARTYPWGNTPDQNSCNNWNGPQLSGMAYLDSGGRGTLPVGSFPNGVSPYGCFDIAGNASEWCNDYYGQTYYRGSPYSNPQGPDYFFARVIRGGDYSDMLNGGIGYNYSNLRCATRDWGRQGADWSGPAALSGFRVCR